MSYIQLDLFDDSQFENPLKGKRICLSGSFNMPPREMNKRLYDLGVTDIKRVAADKVFSLKDTIPPAKEKTDIFVLGSNPHEATLRRWELNAHDGYTATKITESKLYELMDGIISDEDTKICKVTKNLDLNFSYYEWVAPIINGKEFVSRTSSPFIYPKIEEYNTLIEKEIYIPEISGINMNNLRQIVGNIGAYANTYYDSNTHVIILGDDTFLNWKNGIKDNVILSIEENYNKSDNKFFNVCFTTIKEFLTWVTKRANKFNDNITINLINQILDTTT